MGSRVRFAVSDWGLDMCGRSVVLVTREGDGLRVLVGGTERCFREHSLAEIVEICFGLADRGRLVGGFTWDRAMIRGVASGRRQLPSVGPMPEQFYLYFQVAGDLP